MSGPLSLPAAAPLTVQIVRPSFSLEAALGGSFRDNLITESFNVATWPVADWAFPGAPMHDISGRGFNGTWYGSGVTPGVAFTEVPEGLLGANFTGYGWGEVASEVVPDPNFNLSLAGGDVDIACVIKDYVATSVERCIVAKQDGTSLGNGYHLAIANGFLKFYICVGGVQVVNLQSPLPILDIGMHIVTAHYLTAAQRARIYIDGVVRAEVTGLSGVELPYTTGPLRVGLFSGDATADGSGFQGTLGYVSIGREGDETWGPRLMATLPWTPLTDDVRTGPNGIHMRTGIPGVGPTDRVATTGSLTFALDNSTRKHANGYYTPGHLGVRPGWTLGIPIRWTINYGGQQYRQFHGRLSEARPLPGLRAARYVECTVTDWMDVAAATPLSAMPPMVNQRSDKVFLAALAQAAGRTPMSIEPVTEGASNFAFAGDLDTGGGSDSMLSELGRIASSEDGFIYLRGYGNLHFEAHGLRESRAVDAVFNLTMSGLDVTYNLQTLINIVRISYTPRRVGDTIDILYNLDIKASSQKIEGLDTRVIEGSYVDPTNVGGAGPADHVGAIDLQPFTPYTDYMFTELPDGTGADLTGNLDVTAELGGSSFRLTLRNPSDTEGYLHLNEDTGLQIRGRPVFHYAEVVEERRDSQSVRLRGPRMLAISLPYTSNPDAIKDIADYYLGLFDREDTSPTSVLIHGNRNPQLLTECLRLVVGDKIALVEGLTGLTTARSFIIHEKVLSYQAGQLVTATFALAHAQPYAAVIGIPARLNVMRLGTSRLNYLPLG